MLSLTFSITLRFLVSLTPTMSPGPVEAQKTNTVFRQAGSGGLGPSRTACLALAL